MSEEIYIAGAEKTQCPICGEMTTAKAVRERMHWLAYDYDACFDCEDWADMIFDALLTTE